jgi:2-methylisocitrate lyase-like PEP mutase family enzyme
MRFFFIKLGNQSSKLPAKKYMHPSQAAKADGFKKLHERTGIFVIPNPWDIGSAKLLAQLGFEALATTSAGLAFSMGRPDGEGGITRAEALNNAQDIVNAIPLPVSADLENGYGDDPDACAETVLLAAHAGLAGCSIEDATGRPDDPIYAHELAVERIKAAVKATRTLPFSFMLTARAENLIHGRPDLKDTIRRLEAYADAGADVLYAPGLKTREEIDAVVRAVAPRPVNFLMGPGNFSLDDLASLGVKRVSLGSTLARVAYGSFFRAAEEIRQKGTFTFAANTVPYATINQLFS